MRDLALFFAALSDATRLRLLHLMKDGEICVCFLQGVLRSNQPKISRHLAYLRQAGLVEARREGKWIYYSLKKLESEPQEILMRALDHMDKQPQVKKDAKRLQEICCSPTRFGFSSPSSNKKN